MARRREPVAIVIISPSMDYTIQNQHLYIDEEPVSLFSGAFQYWRVERGLWETCLRRVREMGFGIVETYVSWAVHEISPGKFDFGETDPALDLAAWLSLCRAMGLKVLLRPGPHNNAEQTWFGYPERLFADSDLAMRCADGSPVIVPAPPRMFAAPCYHHPRFLAETRTWLEAVAQMVRGYLHPDGPIIAVQVDNELSRFFRTHPFDNDYSADSIRLFRRFLSGKYGSPEELGRAWGADLEDWSLADPPRRMAAGDTGELTRCLDWAEFGEYYILEALRKIADMLRDSLGPDVPLFHNYPGVAPLPPFDLTRSEEFLDFQGIDSYPRRDDYHTLRFGCKATSTLSRLPVMAEFSSGGTLYLPFISLADQEFTSRTVLMHGMRGINFFMLVERERWYGSPVRRDGTVRPDRFNFYRSLTEEVGSWGLEEMSPSRPVLLLLPREYERLVGAAMVPCPLNMIVADQLAGPGVPADLFVSGESYGLSEPVAERYARTRAFWYWALTAAGAHFAIADSSAPAGLLSRHPVVVCPTYEYMERRLQEKLLALTDAGATLIIGPRAPRTDERFEPCDVLSWHLREPVESRADTEVFGSQLAELCLFEDGEAGRAIEYRVAVGAGSMVHLGIVPGEVHNLSQAEVFAPLVDTLLRAGGVEPRFVPSDARLDVAVWEGNGRTLLLVANPTPEAAECEITHVGEGSYRDKRTDEPVGADGVLRLALQPYSIAALEKDR
ncbi:MAG: beta-galactosidase [Actinobacteria bacterium]|nr:beta-galactosidase [Actinomycetota bacterium]MBU2686897.1 beta-galactosidase [Actinomycetota bacterium]